MNDSRIRARWLATWQELDRNANAQKQPMNAVISIGEEYRKLTDAERPAVDRLLSEQLGSNDEDVRFVAIALIQQFGISSALPALRALADWLEAQEWPGAPFEWAKVNRVIGLLAPADKPLARPSWRCPDRYPQCIQPRP